MGTDGGGQSNSLSGAGNGPLVGADIDLELEQNSFKVSIYIVSFQVFFFIVRLFFTNILVFLGFFLSFDFCRFCMVIRFFHPLNNGQ